MKKNLVTAFRTGLERMAAWSDLLDRINVYPVADGDTGRNLFISLSPLFRLDEGNSGRVITQLLLGARGNSGNIAARFLSGFLRAGDVADLPPCARNGRDLAWKAIKDPLPGTMLTVFDDFVLEIERDLSPGKDRLSEIIGRLAASVRSTVELLPRLREAGVADSGALGAFLFFEGFLNGLGDGLPGYCSITETFAEVLDISPLFRETGEQGYCIDTVIRLDGDRAGAMERIAGLGESVLVIPGNDFLKVHLHAADREQARREMSSLGEIVNWSDDDLDEQIRDFGRPGTGQGIHIMTDAAGSLTREDAHALGITLLDSYVLCGDRSLPETFFEADRLYAAMRKGVKASTSQASLFERHQRYESALSGHERVLYLCVGSVFTGNYETALRWKRDHDPDDRFHVMDSQAASGRLGLAALALARFARTTGDIEAVRLRARLLLEACEEYIFLDRLEYLAAGGRLSRTKAFFGDMLHKKPVVTPTAEGAVSAGIVRNTEEQIEFAIGRLRAAAPAGSSPLVMLEYTDTRDFTAGLADRVRGTYPGAEIILQPLSLTTGVHTGPGTWAAAFIPEEALSAHEK